MPEENPFDKFVSAPPNGVGALFVPPPRGPKPPDKDENPFDQFIAPRSSWADKLFTALPYDPHSRALVQEAAAGVPLLGAMVKQTPEMKVLEEHHPYQTVAARTVGGAASIGLVGAAPVVGPLITGVFRSAPMWASPITGAATNAALSGADAYVRGEDVDAASKFGALGGALGPPVASFLGNVAGATAQSIAQGFPNAGKKVFRGMDPRALDVTREYAAKSGLTDQAAVAARQAELGPGAMVMDYGPDLQGLAMATRAHPEGRSGIIGPVMKREAGISPKIDQSLTNAFGPYKNIAREVEALKVQRSQNADPWYENFRRTAISPTPEINDVLTAIKDVGGLKDAAKLAKARMDPKLASEIELLDAGGAVRPPSAEVIQYAKEGVDSLIEQAKRAGSNKFTSAYASLKNALDDAVANHPDKSIAQIWRQARTEYKEPSQIMDALKWGQKWKSYDVDELPSFLQSLNASQREAFMEGVRNDLGKDLTGSVRGSVKLTGASEGKGFFDAPDNELKLRTILQHGHNDPVAGNQRAEALLADMTRYQGQRMTKNAVLPGSNTMPIATIQQDVNKRTTSPVSSLMERVFYNPEVSYSSWMPGVGTLKKRAAAEALASQGQVYKSLVPALTREDQEAADLLTALTQYRTPQEKWDPRVYSMVNALARSGSNVPQVRENAPDTSTVLRTLPWIGNYIK